MNFELNLNFKKLKLITIMNPKAQDKEKKWHV